MMIGIVEFCYGDGIRSPPRQKSVGGNEPLLPVADISDFKRIVVSFL
jgi:hypothetical protein